MKSGLLCLVLIILVGWPDAARGQQVQVQLGPDEIGENQAWTITVMISNDPLKSYGGFPDIQGFRKRGTSTQSQTSIVNGQVSSSQGVIMTYTPIQQGIVTVPSFTMKVNDQAIAVTGKKVKVGPPVQVQARDPFRSLFDGRDPFSDPYGKTEPEYIDIKEDALLALSTSKDEVYVGEGFTATLSFLVADNNRAPMQFHDLGRQLSDILKKLKPSNCWEENFNIENIEGESVVIQGKGYTQYRIYQATFFPLNAESVNFPSVGLEMIKFKVAKNPSFFGQNRQEDFKTFYSKAKTIRVKELPPHPLQQSVAVGNYRLDEEISSTDLRTGQSVAYSFNVSGEGNISSVERPTIPPGGPFDIYEPNVQQNIRREGNRVMGTKSFRYFIVPKEPGQYDLGNYFTWIFFNPAKKAYDTLRSGLSVRVEGESHRNQAIRSTDLGSFYDRIDTADNTLHSSSEMEWVKPAAYVFSALVMAASLFLFFRRRPA
ncbi:MAG: BatD family protein [Cyclobacteriaceae bacterium]|nr:BatD family protein [Cyclobacteriaceae bacterium]